MERYNLKYTGSEIDTILDSANSLSGIIVMWSGAVDNIPTGWALCDGTNGTPNLVNRFIVGAGSSYAVGATGGSNSVVLTTAQLPSHTHTATTDGAGSHTHTGSTSEAGAHTHDVDVPAEAGGAAQDGSFQHNVKGTDEVSTSSAGKHSHTISLNSVSNHTHTVTVTATGSGSAHENRPPYYALAYIMKL